MIKNLENQKNPDQPLGLKIIILEQENQQLRRDNQVLGNELTYFKELSADYEEEINNLKNRCRSLNKRNMQLESEVADMKFTKQYLNSEEAGARFAQELLGVGQ